MTLDTDSYQLTYKWIFLLEQQYTTIKTFYNQIKYYKVAILWVYFLVINLKISKKLDILQLVD